jgi:hypothetical protein
MDVVVGQIEQRNNKMGNGVIQFDDEPNPESPVTFDEPVSSNPVTFDEPAVESPVTFDEPVRDSPVVFDSPEQNDSPVTFDDDEPTPEVKQAPEPTAKVETSTTRTQAINQQRDAYNKVGRDILNRFFDSGGAAPDPSDPTAPLYNELARRYREKKAAEPPRREDSTISPEFLELVDLETFAGGMKDLFDASMFGRMTNTALINTHEAMQARGLPSVTGAVSDFNDGALSPDVQDKNKEMREASREFQIELAKQRVRVGLPENVPIGHDPSGLRGLSGFENIMRAISRGGQTGLVSMAGIVAPESSSEKIDEISRHLQSNPDMQDSFWLNLFPEMVGGTSFIIASGPFAPATGALQASGQGVMEAQQAGANRGTQALSGILNGIIGMSEGLFFRGASQGAKALIGRRWIEFTKQTLKTSGVEVLQEIGQQGGSNLVASFLYDYNRKITDGITPTMAAGSALIGGGTPIIIGAASKSAEIAKKWADKFSGQDTVSMDEINQAFDEVAAGLDEAEAAFGVEGSVDPRASEPTQRATDAFIPTEPIAGVEPEVIQAFDQQRRPSPTSTPTDPLSLGVPKAGEQTSKPVASTAAPESLATDPQAQTVTEPAQTQQEATQPRPVKRSPAVVQNVVPKGTAKAKQKAKASQPRADPKITIGADNKVTVEQGANFDKHMHAAVREAVGDDGTWTKPDGVTNAQQVQAAVDQGLHEGDGLARSIEKVNRGDGLNVNEIQGLGLKLKALLKRKAELLGIKNPSAAQKADIEINKNSISVVNNATETARSGGASVLQTGRMDFDVSSQSIIDRINKNRAENKKLTKKQESWIKKKFDQLEKMNSDLQAEVDNLKQAQADDVVSNDRKTNKKTRNTKQELDGEIQNLRRLFAAKC